MEALIFTASWCVDPCARYVPEASELLRQVQSPLRRRHFARVQVVDIEKNAPLCRLYGIDGVPTILFRRRKEPHEPFAPEILRARIVGRTGLDRVRDMAESVLDE